jgi:hypothetical protein
MQESAQVIAWVAGSGTFLFQGRDAAESGL